MLQTRDFQLDQHAATEIVGGGARLVVVHSVGPRIAWLGKQGGSNVLYWDATGERGRGDWKLRGGHRLWVARPGADESEETYEPDDRACEVECTSARVTVTAPPDRSRLEKSLVMEVQGTTWTITHRLRNAGDMLWSGAAWALTCTAPLSTTRYRIPLDGGDPAWDVLTMIIPRRWGGDHTSRLDDPQFTLDEDALHIRSDGHEAKRMLRVPRGRIEMHDERASFAKSADLVRGASYPLDTNVAVYLAPTSFMVELETMSPLRTLVPGETLEHVETWTIR